MKDRGAQLERIVTDYYEEYSFTGDSWISEHGVTGKFFDMVNRMFVNVSIKRDGSFRIDTDNVC